MLQLCKQPALIQRLCIIPMALRTISFGVMHGNVAAASTSKPANASASKEKQEYYDIIIAGGGMVGTTLAAAIATNVVLSNKSVLLLEGAPPFKGFKKDAQYGNRVSAINNNTIELFATVGAWKRMSEARVKSVKQMQVWDASSDALIQFHHDHFKNDVACIVENDLILDSMHKVLEANPTKKVKIRNQARIKSVKIQSNLKKEISEVHLDNGDVYTCELLVGADGFNSLVRNEMNVDVFQIDYKRMGLVATLLVNDASENAVAWQRFLPNGPIALLPLNEKMSSLVWSTTIDHAKSLAAMPEPDFVNALNEAFCKEYPKSSLVINAVNALNSFMGRSEGLHQYPPRVGGVVPKSRGTFPLGFLHASSYICSGAALIGDAAHRIHPLAGQGVNLGFSDIRHLVDVLAEAAYAGAKLSDKQYLMRYEQKSLAKNVPILIGVHGLQTLYSTTFSPVVLMRSLGLQFANNVPILKNMFMKRAMGN